MAGRNMWGMLVMLGLLAMVQSSMQVSVKNPLPLLPRAVRTDDGSVFGVITSSYRVEKALKESKVFVATSNVEVLGKSFVVGTVYGAPVVFTRTSSDAVNVAVTAQVMVQNFKVQGFVHVTRAGSTNASLVVGSVSVPKEVTVTGNWEWVNEDVNVNGGLVFSQYNLPAGVQSSLGSLKYEKVEVSDKGQVTKGFNVNASPSWLNYASRVQIDSGDVVVGLKSSSSGVYVNNPTYAGFLYKGFGVSTVEKGAAAVALVAKVNGVEFVSFQGVSNQAGTGHASSGNKQVASVNVVKAVVRFVWEASVARSGNVNVNVNVQ